MGTTVSGTASTALTKRRFRRHRTFLMQRAGRVIAAGAGVEAGAELVRWLTRLITG